MNSCPSPKRTEKQEAEDYYQGVLKANARHFGSVHGLGVIRLQQGRHGEADESGATGGSRAPINHELSSRECPCGSNAQKVGTSDGPSIVIGTPRTFPAAASPLQN